MKIVYLPNVKDTPFVLQTNTLHYFLTLEQVKELRRSINRSLEASKK